MGGAAVPLSGSTSRPRTSSCVASSRCTSSAACGRGGSMLRPASAWRAGQAVRLAQRFGRRAARNHDPLASRGLEAAVAREVATWPTSDSGGTARADPQDGRARTRCGVKSASPTSCCSSWAFGSHREPCASTCRSGPRASPRGDQRWSTFLKNHATAILACDFFVAVTATFRMLYVFVVIEHGTRRLAHLNVTAHPSADWTLQQLREVVGDTDNHEYLIHDRDAIFAKHLDNSIRALGLAVLRSPFASPKANAICERVIGTIRRECLDWMIPMSEAHLRSILRRWVTHYNAWPPAQRIGPWRAGSSTAICASSSSDLNPDIDWRRVRSCSPDRCWAACITSTRSRRCRRTRCRCLEGN